MALTLPDLSSIKSPADISAAVMQFREMSEKGLLTADQQIQLAVKMSRQIFSQVTGNLQWRNQLIEDHLDGRYLSMMLSYFPAYASMVENPHQEEMVEGLYQLYQPFTTLGYVRPSAPDYLPSETFVNYVKAPSLWGRDGKLRHKPTHLVNLFNHNDLAFEVGQYLKRKDGLAKILDSISASDTADRIVVESVVFSMYEMCCDDEEAASDFIKQRVLPVSILVSGLRTRTAFALMPGSGGRSLGVDTEVLSALSEEDRHLAFDCISAGIASMMLANRDEDSIKGATKTLRSLFDGLKPFGFDPMSKLGQMGLLPLNTKTGVESKAAEKAAHLHKRPEKPLVIAWLDAALAGLDVETVISKSPSGEAAQHLHAITQDTRYLDYARGYSTARSGLANR